MKDCRAYFPKRKKLTYDTKFSQNLVFFIVSQIAKKISRKKHTHDIFPPKDSPTMNFPASLLLVQDTFVYINLNTFFRFKQQYFSQNEHTNYKSNKKSSFSFRDFAIHPSVT